MAGIDFSILNDQQMSDLFGNSEESTENVEDTNTTEESTEESDKENNEETTEINSNSLFEDTSESVGSEEQNNEEKKDTTSNTGGGTSPKNFYSSITKALEEEGIFPDLDEETISKVQSPEDFRNLIDDQIKAGLDERQKRIDEALSVGVEPDAVRQYENVISWLDNVSEEALTAENDQGEDLRKRLIYQDFINRGYSQARAEREVKKSIDGGTDIEDAKEALVSTKEYYQDSYNNLIEERKGAEAKFEEQRKKDADKLQKSILDDANFFGGLTVDKSIRKKAFENISKATYRDPETGNYYTALQKYERENRLDFIKNVGLLFTITDGFKNLDKLVKGKVNKEVKKGLKNLEQVLNTTSRDASGNLQFVGNDDKESYFKGWSVDI